MSTITATTLAHIRAACESEVLRALATAPGQSLGALVELVSLRVSKHHAERGGVWGIVRDWLLDRRDLVWPDRDNRWHLRRPALAQVRARAQLLASHHVPVIAIARHLALSPEATAKLLRC